MFWQEETPIDQFQVSGDVLDLVFDIDCRELPVDHAYALATALTKALPEMMDDPRIGIHAVHVAGSQNGWERPAHNTQNRLILSHRTKLILRLPQEQQTPIQDRLTGLTLDIDGCPMHIRSAKARCLSKHTTLFARYVACTDMEDETVFLHWAAQELQNLDIRIRKAICGKTNMLTTPNGQLTTRSLLLAELSLEESVRLQQQGIGGYHNLGCGIFLPHKGIGAVNKASNE